MEKCRLCQIKNKELKKSHIIPKMFFNILAKNSITGKIRETSLPNKTIQDGYKIPLLCGECENLFSKYEKFFSDNIYQSIVKKDGEIEFDSNNSNLSYFLLSISWRVIVYVMEKDETTFSEKEKIKINKIISKWRDLLKNKQITEIDKIKQFIIPTKNLEILKNIPTNHQNNIWTDFKTFDKKDEFKFGFTIVQVPYFIFITTVWGNTSFMKNNLLGEKNKTNRL